MMPVWSHSREINEADFSIMAQKDTEIKNHNFKNDNSISPMYTLPMYTLLS